MFGFTPGVAESAMCDGRATGGCAAPEHPHVDRERLDALVATGHATAYELVLSLVLGVADIAEALHRKSEG